LALQATEFHFSRCKACGAKALWRHRTLVDPRVRTAPFANPDLPPDVAEVYEEAATVHQDSPRAAAALLRLAIQLLVSHLGANDRNLNDAIGALVRDGLPESVQQALDAVRVLGNNAVHPGQLDLNELPETADALFRLVNFIAENRISEPAEVKAIYELLPRGARQQVTRRDGRDDDTD
jgi:hypothetical protein